MGGGIIDDELRLFELGAVTSFIARYFADVFHEVFIDNNYKIDIGSTPYIASTIAGGFAATIIAKTNLFAGVVAAVGLYKVVYAALSCYLGEKELSETLVLKDFIFDSIMVYYVVLTIKAIINMINPREDSSPDSNIITDLIIAVSVQIYYKVKFKITSKNKCIY